MHQLFPSYGFRFFYEYDFNGLIIRDPITSMGNLFLFFVGIWCYSRIAKFNVSPLQEVRAGVKGWRLFFLFSSIAYSFGIPLHGFSYYIPEEIHFWIWISMGWIQMLGVYFVQVGTAKRYFPNQVKWIRPLAIIQALLFCSLMVYLRKFAMVNIDFAIGLVPIAFWNLYLYAKKKNSSPLIAVAILFTGIPGILFTFKIMLAPWFSYIDAAHLLMIGSLLLVYFGLKKCVETGLY